jgi:hypothetical protein
MNLVADRVCIDKDSIKLTAISTCCCLVGWLLKEEGCGSGSSCIHIQVQIFFAYIVTDDYIILFSSQ